MSAPVARTELRNGLTNTIVYGGTDRLAGIISAYGIPFIAVVEGVYALIVDPRFSLSSVLGYIVELGGTVYEYVAPPE